MTKNIYIFQAHTHTPATGGAAAALLDFLSICDKSLCGRPHTNTHACTNKEKYIISDTDARIFAFFVLTFFFSFFSPPPPPPPRRSIQIDIAHASQFGNIIDARCDDAHARLIFVAREIFPRSRRSAVRRRHQSMSKRWPIATRLRTFSALSSREQKKNH